MPGRSESGILMTVLSMSELQDGNDKSDTGTKQAFRLKSEKTITGTWNVRTLHACDKKGQQERKLQPYPWDIIGLSEVKWTGFMVIRKRQKTQTRLRLHRKHLFQGLYILLQTYLEQNYYHPHVSQTENIIMVQNVPQQPTIKTKK